MVEAFCSVYTKDFRHVLKDDEPEEAIPCSPFDPEENFLPEKDSKVIYNPQRDEEVIRGLAKKRMQTSYQVAYNHPDGKRSKSGDPFSDEFMTHFNKAFEEKTHAVLRPPETSRRINGYSRFEYYYTGRTTYEEEISREAYKAFKRDFDQGISRLFARRQKAERLEKEQKATEG